MIERLLPRRTHSLKLTNVFLLELSRKMPLNECGLADASIANENELEFRDLVSLTIRELFFEQALESRRHEAQRESLTMMIESC